MIIENTKEENSNNKNIVPIYKIARPIFSKKEKGLLEELRNNLVDLAISSKGEFEPKKDEQLENIKNFLKFRIETIDNTYLNKLAYSFYHDIFGYGKIDPLIKDKDLEEIMVIGVNKPIFVYHRKHGMMETDLIFKNEEDILSLIDSIARQINRRIDQQSPILDTRLPDGSRVNATIPPISAEGPSITIRKFNEDPLSIIDLIKSNTLNSSLAAFLWTCVDGLGVNPANIIISGGTSSGKTTTLNALCGFINPRERIVSIEDTLELQIQHKHILKMETRPTNIESAGEITMDDLVKNSLRQRPDRIIVGEVRGKEAITLFTALNTGHSGFGTLHANNSRETITRLINHPMDVPKIMISAIDLIIMQNKIYHSSGGAIRRITEVSEVVGMEEDTIQLNKIFNWNPKNDEIEDISISSNTLKTLSEIKATTIESIKEEIKKREFILDFAVKNNINSNTELNSLFEEYYLNSDDLINYIQTIK